MSNEDTINLEDVSSQGRPFLKTGVYSIRCINCEKQKSRKNNDMLVFEYEIVSPTAVKQQDVNDSTKEREVNIAGLKLTDWIVFNDFGLAKFKSLHKAMKLPMTLNKVTPNTKQYVGRAVRITLTTEPMVTKDENTGEPMLDDENNPITMNNYRIQRFNGADEEHTIPQDSQPF